MHDTVSDLATRPAEARRVIASLLNELDKAMPSAIP